MLSTIFIILAAICNAVIDILENENFYGSIFKNLDDDDKEPEMLD